MQIQLKTTLSTNDVGSLPRATRSGIEMNILTKVAKRLNMDEDRVRAILLELPEATATPAEQEKTRKAAVQEGLDPVKLQVGRRIEARKEAIEDVLKYIEAHPTWKKEEIIAYMRYTGSLLRRVQKKILPDLFT